MKYLKDDYLIDKTCPRCGQEYTGRPAVSRKDNTTMLCPDCGTREALESIGIGGDEQDKILEIIHRSMQDNNVQ